MIGQILDECNGTMGIPNDINVHSKYDKEHALCLNKLMWITPDFSMVPNPEKSVVKATSVSFFQIFQCVYNQQIVLSNPAEVC